MTRVAMFTLLVVICTALIVEAKSVHRRKRNSESPRIKRKLPYGWEKIKDPKFGYYYINHNNGRTEVTPPPPDSGNNPPPTSAPITKQERGACKEGWRSMFGFCFYVSDFADVKSQSEASAACKKLGTDLFWQTHTYESYWLSQVIRTKVSLSTFFLWTNGVKQNDQWGWGTGKPAFKEPQWEPGQPNDDGKCITIYAKNGKIHDKPCEKKYNYVCKKIQ
ncbi:lithostathine-1-alpha-like isoform X2 [Mytilus californianus]|uniref:lithostathine-1-alpha-like isoform X2 n=1 Tax=Mytilus californianus TaxID=6549 RepID=UPI0022450F66|nr:lithostathine-1-alpha-like isoform X2 [Mytilus californianus]